MRAGVVDGMEFPIFPKHRNSPTVNCECPSLSLGNFVGRCHEFKVSHWLSGFGEGARGTGDCLGSEQCRTARRQCQGRQLQRLMPPSCGPGAPWKTPWKTRASTGVINCAYWRALHPGIAGRERKTRCRRRGMTVSETDRRRRRLLVRSLMGAPPDSGSTDNWISSETEVPANLAEDIELSNRRGTTDFKSVPPPDLCAQRREPPAPRSVVVGPTRVIESQLDAVLRTLGTVTSPATPAPPPVAPAPVRQVPLSTAPPLMLPPFQNLPTKRPAPFRRPPPVETPPRSAPATQDRPEPAQAVTAPAVSTPSVSVPIEVSPEPVATIPMTTTIAERPAAPLVEPAPTPEVISTPTVSERSEVLRSRSKIGTMKLDAVALSARMKELAKLLEECPDAPSDDALCAWDDCRRLALLLHHELDRGLPQPESQRNGRAAAKAR